jgi:aminomethyltransferase
MDKKTPLYDRHVALGAKIEPFAGYFMPIQYSSVIGEHLAVRKNAGIFDLSHMGEFRVKGPQARSFLDMLLTNNTDVEAGKAFYSAMCYPDAGIVDDLIVYRISADEFLMVVNAANLEKDWAWVTSHAKGWDLKLTNESDEIALVAVQGPSAQKIASKFTETDLEAIPYYAHASGKVAGVDALIARTGYTGEDGFEFYVAARDATTVWDAIMADAPESGIVPVGLAARDTLRLEVGYVLYGNDIDHTTTPLEAKLGWVVKLASEKDFIGREVLARQKEEGLGRTLVGMAVDGKGIIRHGTAIFSGDEKVGTVTSGTLAPALGTSVGLGYVQKAFTKTGTALEAEIRGNRIPVKVVKIPFYTKGSRR